jgi:hypothetical protein
VVADFVSDSDRSAKKMTLRLIVGALPLLIYPFVALASGMSLAGHTDSREPALLMTVARGFQITSLLYPAVYLVALAVAVALRKKKREAAAVRIATIPLWFLAVVVTLMVGWFALGA